MRKRVTVLLLLGFACQAMAMKTATVEQMEQLLARMHDKPDGKVAHELEDLQLTERVSPARLAHWETAFPGSRTRQELIRLADLSAFIDPPASEVIPDPPPDPDTQRHMLWMAEQYMGSTMSRLPNFFATRETTHFEAASSSKSDSADGSAKPLQWTGVTSGTVTYRGGREILFEAADKPDAEPPASGLTSHGEFGPILSQVLSDALESEVRFLRWEQGPSEPAAVFHYSVPEEASHFKLDLATGGQEQPVHPAYHGEIEIDPETGAILRLSEISSMSPPHQVQSTSIEVEFAPVTIGDRTFFCPVKAVFFTRIPVPAGGATKPNRESPDQSSWPIETDLNDVMFSHYHE
ncbi:MAG: hypothetical protein WBP85_13525 [Terracidiphilus sp.]